MNGIVPESIAKLSLAGSVNTSRKEFRMTALKSLLFLVIAPGMVAGYIPLTLLRKGSQIDTGFFAYLAFPLWLIGGVILLWYMNR